MPPVPPLPRSQSQKPRVGVCPVFFMSRPFIMRTGHPYQAGSYRSPGGDNHCDQSRLNHAIVRYTRVWSVGLFASSATATPKQPIPKTAGWRMSCFFHESVLSLRERSIRLRNGRLVSKGKIAIWRHCERSAAIQFNDGAGLPRRFAPRNDGGVNSGQTT